MAGYHDAGHRLTPLDDPMANDEQVAILKKGVHAWNAWRDENPNIIFELDLSSADLRRACLSGANLGWANLNRVGLGKVGTA
jgi:uncharacterized protein YjbI with pentapeptide repeats